MGSTGGCWRGWARFWQAHEVGAGMTTATPMLLTNADVSVLVDAERGPVTLHLSPRTIAQRHWPQGRPGAWQLERAIDEVETAIEQSGLAHADRGALQVNEHLRHALPQRLRAPGTFSRDEVEAEFSWLVAASGSAAGLPPASTNEGEAAAALLLVRELMHHLGFQALKTSG
jgi:hypothetical protein